ISVWFPSFRAAANRASSGAIPRAMFSSVSISKCASSSRARSASHFVRRKYRSQLIALVLGGSQYSIDRVHHLCPAARLVLQLLSPERSQPVISRFAIIFRCAPERRDPLAILQAVQRRIKRAMLDLQHFVRAVLDYMGNRVPVRRPQHERLENQQVQRSLQQVGLQGRCTSFRHWLWTSLEATLGSPLCSHRPSTASEVFIRPYSQ